MPPPVLIVPLPVNRFSNKIVPKVPNNIQRSPSFCSFALFLIVSLTPFINQPSSSRDLIYFMISIISSLKDINVVLPDPNIFLWIAASVADAAVKPNGIKTLFANGLSTFSIKCNPAFSNGPKSLPKSPPDCCILCNWVFDNFIFAEELFAEALRSFETCVLVKNNLWGKLFSVLESPITFGKTLKVTSVPFFIPDFSLLIKELDNFTFKVLYWVILYWYHIILYIISKTNHNTFTVPREKFKMVSCASTIKKIILAHFARAKFPVKLIFYIAFGTALSTCRVFKSIPIIL